MRPKCATCLVLGAFAAILCCSIAFVARSEDDLSTSYPVRGARPNGNVPSPAGPVVTAWPGDLHSGIDHFASPRQWNGSHQGVQGPRTMLSHGIGTFLRRATGAGLRSTGRHYPPALPPHPPGSCWRRIFGRPPCKERSRLAARLCPWTSAFPICLTTLRNRRVAATTLLNST
jgi:hypothetical protein